MQYKIIQYSILVVIFFFSCRVWGAESAQPAQEGEQNLSNPMLDGQETDSSTAAKEEDKAVNFSFLYSGELWDNVNGGVKEGQSTINNFDVSVSVDGEKTFGWDGSNFLLDGFYARSGDLRNLTGATQQSSAYETDTASFFRLYQALYNQKFNSDDTSIFVGLYDVNTDFDNFETSGLFFNSGYGLNTAFDQTGLNDPSTYPDTSLALGIKDKLAENWDIKAAVLDGVSDNPAHPTSTDVQFGDAEGALILGEVDYHPEDKSKFAIGYWRYTADFNELGEASFEGSPIRKSGNQGGYAGLQNNLYDAGEKRGLDGFVRLGMAADEFNQFDRSLDGGLVYTGLIPGRETDRLGIAMNIAQNGTPYKDQIGGHSDDYETNAEMTYRAIINDWLTVQPDAQYFIHPGTNPALKNDLIIGLRFEIGYQTGL